MEKKRYIFVANWKIYTSMTALYKHMESYTGDYESLAQMTGHTIILCPTAPALYAVCKYSTSGTIYFGGQDCSPYQFGAHTGSIQAQALADVGCSYCIIGHHEVRTSFHETSDDVAAKIPAIAAAGLVPIVCIGDHEQAAAEKDLQEQLDPVLLTMHNLAKQPQKCIIAYEPIWAIGSGLTPSPEELTAKIGFIKDYCESRLSSPTSLSYLYGGSVNQHTITPLVATGSLDGFLIGRASLDVQEFKNMILLCSPMYK